MTRPRGDLVTDGCEIGKGGIYDTLQLISISQISTIKYGSGHYLIKWDAFKIVDPVQLTEILVPADADPGSVTLNYLWASNSKLPLFLFLFIFIHFCNFLFISANL